MTPARHLATNGMHRPDMESDSCGVGLVAATDGLASRRVVEAALEVLRNVWHRGAVDADGKTGDGAGLHLDIPHAFFADAIDRSGHVALPSRLAVGQMFLPRTDLTARETCRTIVESEMVAAGLTIYGWRQVPVNVAAIGPKAALTRPEIEQILVAGPLPDQASAAEFDKTLYLVRRRIERAAIAQQVRDFYVCSLSCRSVIYKGLFLAEALTDFYPDLLDERFTSRVAIFHQRYSTNTFPQWWLAQPFRCLAHNGEINTVRRNKSWMRSHEIKMASVAFGEHCEDVTPVVPAGASDTAALDAVFEVLCRSGKDAPSAKLMLVPEAWQAGAPATHEALGRYNAAHMEPWDGPAALCMTDGRWAVAGLDRSALRPLRYTRTTDGLLVVGSETGLVALPEGHVLEKGRLGLGGMIAVDLEAGRFYTDGEIKDRVAGERDYAALTADYCTPDDLPPVTEAPARYARPELTRRQVAAGQTLEDLELILAPMAEVAKEAVGSMGDDTPLAVVSDKPRLVSQFFRQNFSQVTKPPIDPLRERHVMSLTTRFANLGNILEETAGGRVLELPSPVLLSAEWARLRDAFGPQAATLDCTFAAGGGPERLREAIARVRGQAEAAVRGGRSELFLTDEAIGPERVGLSAVLAAAAVHTHLVRVGLRSDASINVRSAEALDTHAFAVLIGTGATTVSAYLTEAAIADRHARGLLGALSLTQALENYRTAIDNGLLKIMAKLGIAVVSSYRGGYNFEAVGLSRSLVADLFPGMPAKISGEGYASLQLNASERHRAAFDMGVARLPVGGFYRQRHGGETHAWGAELMHLLQTAVATDS